jgi:glycerol dehydrogenase-like iron-containing ADH family enzyme
MPVSERDMITFPTVFGRELLEEVPNFVAPPFLVVTMADLWPRLQRSLPAGTRAHFVESMEVPDLEAQLVKLDGISSVIGLGGGQAIDCAKYFAWRRNLRLYQFPTSLSVDAMYGQRAAVRDKGMVRYVGWAIPETVYFDYAILGRAPPHVNHAGIGDVFCFFTGVWDWEYAHRVGRCEARWPYDPTLAQVSLSKAEAALAEKEEIRDLTPRGIELIVNAFKWGGASFLGAGWCPRHVEGVEHYLFYALEGLTGKKFIHGQAVCLGIVCGAMMHGRRVDELRSAIATIGVDIRPAAMGITWNEVNAAVSGLSDFVRRAELPYGIAHDFQVDEAFLGRLRVIVEEAA